MDPEAFKQMATLVVGGLGAGIGMWIWFKLQAAADAAWQEAADELKLGFRKGGLLATREITGKVGGYDVCVDTVRRGSGKNKQTYTRLRLMGGGAFDVELRLKAESSWEGFKKVFAGEDVQLDEEDFDKAVNVRGPEDVVVAALGAEARRAVLRLVAQQAEIDLGNVAFEVRGLIRDPDKIVRLLREMAQAADALRVDSVPAALQRNAAEDPEPGVRRRNLEVLVGQHRGTPEAAVALEAAINDPAPEVRLLAARHLPGGPVANAVLGALFDDPKGLPATARPEVLKLLLERLPYESLSARVANALKSPDPALQAVAVAAAGRAKDARLLLAHPKLASTGDPALGRALAAALEEAPRAEGEPLLLELLKSEVPEIKLAAAKALESVGTVRAVEPLLPLTAGLLADGELKAAARDAVRAIQARLGDAGGGRLSVVEPVAEEGGLSLEEGGKAHG